MRNRRERDRQREAYTAPVVAPVGVSHQGQYMDDIKGGTAMGVAEGYALILKVGGLALCTSFGEKILEASGRKEFAVLLRVGATVIFGIFLIDVLKDFFNFIGDVFL